MADTDHEQPSSVRCSDHLVPIEDNRSVSLNCDAQQAGFGRQDDGARPNRRPVGPTLLTGLLDLDQYPAWPFAAKHRTPTYQLVSAFYRLDPQH